MAHLQEYRPEGGRFVFPEYMDDGRSAENYLTPLLGEVKYHPASSTNVMHGNDAAPEGQFSALQLPAQWSAISEEDGYGDIIRIHYLWNSCGVFSVVYPEGVMPPFIVRGDALYKQALVAAESA